jgi:hypothetical protein
MSQDSLIKMPFPCVHVVCDQEHRVPRKQQLISNRQIKE